MEAEKVSKPTPQNFSDYLFWDIDRIKVYVIDRVLLHGMFSDWYLIKQLYGKETIKEVVLQLRYLDKYALHFCSAYFDEPLNHFRCYNYAPSNLEH